MTFVDERPTDTATLHTKQEVHAGDVKNDISESQWNMKDVLTREYPLKNFEWGVSAKRDDKLIEEGLPKMITDDKECMITRQLQFFAFLRCGVKVRIQLNGTKFHCGRLIAYFKPLTWSDDTEENFYSLTCFPHVFLDASVSNSAILEIPFTHLLTHFSQQTGTVWNESINALGSFVIRPFNALQAATGSSQVLFGQVYVSLMNPEVHLPTLPIDQFSYGTGYMQGLEGVLKKTAGGLISSGLGLADKFTGGLVTGAGDAVCKLLGVCDKPSDPVAPAAMLNRTVAPLSHGAGLDKSVRLALCPTSQTETTADILGAYDGDNDLDTLCKIPCLLDTVEWSDAQQPETKLFDMLASPVYLSDSQLHSNADKAVSTYFPTMLAYVSRAFCYWRGDLKVKIQVVATQFHSGRLALVFDPHGTGKFNLEEYKKNRSHNIVVMDIQEQQEIVVDLPYFAVRPWLRCDKFRSSSNLNDTRNLQNSSYLDCEAMGVFRIYVLNSLVRPENVAGKIDVNVFVFAGNNFELGVPNPVAPLSARLDMATQYAGEMRYPWCDPNGFDIDCKPEEAPCVKPENKVCKYESLILDTYETGKKLASRGYIKSKDQWYDIERVIETDETVTFAYSCWKIYSMLKEKSFDSNCVKLVETLPKFETSPLSKAVEKVVIATTDTAAKLSDPVIPDLARVKRDVADTVQNSRTAYSDLKEILNQVNKIATRVNQLDTTELLHVWENTVQAGKDLKTIEAEVQKLRESVSHINPEEMEKFTAALETLDVAIQNTQEAVFQSREKLEVMEKTAERRDRELTKLTLDTNEKAHNLQTTSMQVGKCYRQKVFGRPEEYVHWRVVSDRPCDPEAPAKGEEQGDESFTTTRDRNGSSVAMTDGSTAFGVAKTTLSENAMNLQTVMRRFYPLWVSPTLLHSNKFTLITIPVSPSFVVDAHENQLYSKAAQNYSMHNLAWFSRLFTYSRGSLRYKILFTADNSDVYVWHNPVDAKKFAITSGIDYSTVTDETNFATEVAVSKVQQGIEVEVPFYSGFNQLLHSHIAEKQDLRAQNGTLYVAVRNTGSPFTMSVYISTGDDYFMNVLRMAPVVHEGWHDKYVNGADKQVEFPELQKEMTHRSNHVQVPGTGVFERHPGVLAYCPNKFVDSQPQDFSLNQLPEQRQQMEEQMFSPTETVAQIAKKMTGIDRMEEVYETEIRPKMTNADSLITEMRAMVDELQKDTIPAVLGHAKLFHRDVKDTQTMIADFIPKLEEAFEHFNACMIRYNQVGETWQQAGEVIGSVVGTAGFMMETIIVSGIWLNIVEIRKKFKWVHVLNLVCLTCSLFKISPVDIVGWIIQQANKLYEAFRAKSNDGAMATGSEQGLEEFLSEYSEETSMALAGFATVIYCAMFGKLPKWEYIKRCVKETVEGTEQGLADTMRNIHFANMGFKAIKNTYEFFQEWMRKLIDWLLGNENRDVILERQFKERAKQVEDWIDEIAQYEDEDLCHLALVDIDAHNKLYRLMDQGKEFLRWVIAEKVSKVVSSVIRDAQRRLNEVVKRMNEIRPGHGFRYAPFVVMLDGPSSIAKTNVMYKFSDMFREELDIPYYNSKYSVPTTAKYLDGYQGQTIIEWDDMMQCPDQDVLVAEFINWRSNADFIVNKASLNEKGMHFTSKAITITTNNGDVKLNTVRTMEAFRNRINVKFACKLAPGWNVARLKALREKDVEYSFLRFDAYDMDRRGEKFVLIEADMTYAQAMEYTRRKFRAWDEKQKNLVDEFMMDHGDLRMPKGVIVRPEEFVDPEMENPGNVDIEQEIAEAVEQGETVTYEATIDSTAEMSELEQVEAELFVEEFNEKTEEERESYYRRFIKRKDRAVQSGKKFWILLKKKLGIWTSQWSESISTFFKNHPRVKQTLQIVGTLLSLGLIVKTIIGMFQPVIEEAYEPTSKGAKPRLVKAEAYEPTGKVAPPRLVSAEGLESEEGCADTNTLVFARTAVEPALYPIGWEDGCRMEGMMIGGKQMLAPHHFFRKAKDGDRFWVRRGEYNVIFEFQKERLERIGEKDASLYHLGAAFQSRKKITHMFISETDLNRLGKATEAILVGTTREGVVHERSTTATSNARLSYKGKDEGAPVYVQDGWFYPVDTVAGECGSALMLCSSHLPSPRRIAGIHTAGYSDRRGGFSVLLTQEMIVKASEILEARCGKTILPSPLPAEVDTSEEGVEQIHLWPQGDFSVLGVMDKTMCPSQPQKTSFQKTPFHGVFPVKRKPAHLHKVDGKSPIRNSLDKYGFEVRPFSERHLKSVINDMTLELAQFKGMMKAEKVTDEVAVFGNPHVPYAEPMNMKSSPGWPYQCLPEYTGCGKKYMFDEETGQIVNKDLIERLRQREECAKQGKRVPSVWRDCMKDELRPCEKVDQMKTRLFTIAPVDYTILVRKYFMSFVQMFYQNHSKFYSAVGMNPESFDWTVAYARLAEYGDMTVAGDFSKFDGTLMPELIMACAEVIDNWYKIQGELDHEATIVRQVLFDEIVHTVQLVNNCVYQTHKGNPSGNPLTVVVNTMVNAMYMRLTWMEIMSEKAPHMAALHAYHENVKEEIYGDDNRLVIKLEAIELFNQLTITETLARHGITYTTESKGEATEPWRPLLQTSFLKRHYRIDPEIGKEILLPVMDMDTIEGLANWVRKHPDLQEQLQMDQKAMLDFCFLHGREEYKRVNETICKAMLEHNFRPLSISYEEQLDRFLALLHNDKPQKFVRVGY
ncbi:MAG: polyprotein [Guiyang Dicistro-like virus 3]|nr:MAG: polyprotein [Guiyang Dicistro-like virus 3]